MITAQERIGAEYVYVIYMYCVYLDEEARWFDECFYNAGSKHPAPALLWVETELLINEQCVSVKL